MTRPRRASRGDALFQTSVMLVAASVLMLIWLLMASLIMDASMSIERFGVGFLTNTTWDPNRELFTALPFVFGTLVTSGIAIAIGVPLSIGIAICLSELAPGWLREPLAFLIELLAAVPSVIYGLWAMYTLRPMLVQHAEPALAAVLGWTPFFEGTAFGIDKLAAGVILAVMIIPTVASVSKETMMAVPNSQREAALSLGATKYETTKIAVLSYARSGIFGAAILGLGRAIGETMAVTMTIGNSNTISWSLLDPDRPWRA